MQFLWTDLLIAAVGRWLWLVRPHKNMIGFSGPPASIFEGLHENFPPKIKLITSSFLELLVACNAISLTYRKLIGYIKVLP